MGASITQHIYNKKGGDEQGSCGELKQSIILIVSHPRSKRDGDHLLVRRLVPWFSDGPSTMIPISSYNGRIYDIFSREHKNMGS